MRKRHIRILACVLAVAVAAIIPVAQPASAATVKTNVITKVKHKIDIDDETTYVTVNAYKYNKKGLVTQIKTYLQGNESDIQLQVDYKYGSNNLVKKATIQEYGQNKIKATYTYNAKNQLTKRVTKFPYDGNPTMTTKFTYKKGKLKKAAKTYSNMGIHPDGTTTTAYTLNKKGYITKKIFKDPADDMVNTTNTYAYDKNGYVKKMTYAGGGTSGTTTTKYTVKKGKLTKYVKTTNPNDGIAFTDTPYTVSTKKISVDKKLSSIVKEQQREIVNGFEIYLGYDFIY